MTADTCPDCGGVGWLRLDVPPGHPQFGKLVPCDNRLHAPERIARLSKVSNLSPADVGRRIDDIKPTRDRGNEKMLQAAREMVANPYGWLYVWGGPGNAKSEILIAVVNELGLAGYGTGMYTSFTSLINWMRDSFRERKAQEKAPDTEMGYIERFERVLKVKVLAIDEMDKARETEFAEEFRFHFLDERYRQAIRGETVTLFASNTDPAQLPEPLYDRVRDGRFKVVHNTAPSARPVMKR